MTTAKFIQIIFIALSVNTTTLPAVNAQPAYVYGEDKISKCVEALKLPDTKRIYNNVVGEKLQAQLDEVETALKSEKDAGKIKQLEEKRAEVLDQIDEKLAKKCKSLSFIEA